MRLKVARGTRPTSERVRQAIFSSLAAAVVDARVLDLYCGSGAFGLEALSRGADVAVFVDRDPSSLNVARDNARTTGVQDRAVFHRRDVLRYVEADVAREGQFDLVFADPPYAQANTLSRVLSSLQEAVSRNGRVVLEGPKTMQVTTPPGWVLEADRPYGDTRVLVYRHSQPGDESRMEE